MSNTGPTVLVVDDDPAFAEFMAKTVEAAGYTAAVAHNGTDGLRLARNLVPVLVFCDLSMPGLGGVEVLRMLRTDPATAHIARVLVSGHICPHLHGIAAESSLAKPVTSETVRRVLDTLLKAKAA